MKSKNQIQDILYGVAVGDALGVPVEFESREYLKKNPVKDMRDGGIHDQGRGTWSDDSSLTFILAETIIQGYNINLLSKKFIAWKNDAYWTARGEVFDIGNTTRQSISNLEKGIHPNESGGFEENDNGNGSLMRILPLVIHIKDFKMEKRFEFTKQASLITHAHNRSIIACFYYLEFARQILEGKEKFEIYENLKFEIPNFLNSNSTYFEDLKHFERLLTNNIFDLSEEEIESGGYVIHTLEASIWCILTSNNYEDTVLKAVNLGGDTDTTGAVTGGLAGILYGFSSIPKKWIFPIQKIDNINQLIHSYNEQINSLNCRMTIHYNITTFGDTDENDGFPPEPIVKYESVPFELDAVLWLTNEDGTNSLSFDFKYPNYPISSKINYELESENAFVNDKFYAVLDFYEFIFINEDEAILKGTFGINLKNGNDVDCFKYQLLVQQKNCKEIINNSTITIFYCLVVED